MGPICPAGSRDCTSPRPRPLGRSPISSKPTSGEGSVLLPPWPRALGFRRVRELRKEHGSHGHRLYRQGSPSLRGKGRSTSQGRWDSEMSIPYFRFPAAAAGHLRQGVSQTRPHHEKNLEGRCPKRVFVKSETEQDDHKTTATNVGPSKPSASFTMKSLGCLLNGVKRCLWLYFRSIYLRYRDNKALCNILTKFIT